MSNYVIFKILQEFFVPKNDKSLKKVQNAGFLAQNGQKLKKTLDFEYF